MYGLLAVTFAHQTQILLAFGTNCFADHIVAFLSQRIRCFLKSKALLGRTTRVRAEG